MHKITLNLFTKVNMTKSEQYAYVELEPFFIIDSNNFIYDISTGNSKIDLLVKSRISKDHTRVKRILSNPYKTVKYEYNPKRNRIILTVKRTKGEWTMEDAKEMNESYIDPHNAGPDGWMEGDIGILGGKELKNTKYSNKDYIELGVIARKIDVPAKVSDVNKKLDRKVKVKEGETVDITEVMGGASYDYAKKKTYISPSKNNKYRGRKAPIEKASTYKVGTRKIGLDSTYWVIIQTKNGVNRWSRLRRQ